MLAPAILSSLVQLFSNLLVKFLGDCTYLIIYLLIQLMWLRTYLWPQNKDKKKEFH